LVVCRKKGFAKRPHALKALAEMMRRKKGRHKRRLNVYWCPLCEKHHIGRLNPAKKALDLTDLIPPEMRSEILS